MPGIIGNNNVEPTGGNFGTDTYALIYAATLYTAVAGDQLTHFFAYGNRGPGPTLEVAAYDFAGGVPVNRIAPSVSIAMGAADGWWSADPPAPIDLTPGTVYCIAFSGVGFPRLFNSAEPSGISRDGAAPLPALWVHVGSIWFKYSVFAQVEAGAPPARRIYYPCRAQLIT